MPLLCLTLVTTPATALAAGDKQTHEGQDISETESSREDEDASMKSPSNRIAGTGAAHRRLTFAVPSPPPLPRLLPRRHASATPLPHFCYTFATLLPHFTTPPHLCHTISVFLAVSLSRHTCNTYHNYHPFAAPLPHVCRAPFSVSLSLSHTYTPSPLFRACLCCLVSLCVYPSLNRHSFATRVAPVPHLCHTCATPPPHLAQLPVSLHSLSVSLFSVCFSSRHSLPHLFRRISSRHTSTLATSLLPHKHLHPHCNSYLCHNFATPT